MIFMAQIKTLPEINFNLFNVTYFTNIIVNIF